TPRSCRYPTFSEVRQHGAMDVVNIQQRARRRAKTPEHPAPSARTGGLDADPTRQLRGEPESTVAIRKLPAHTQGMDNQRNIRALEPMLTSEELAEYLQVPIKTIYEWRTNRTGPAAYRLGKYTRYRSSDIEAWLKE